MNENNPSDQKMNERPLVTFALFAYNQEKYIREAVEGAFSQTYTPLQIILSDDCSPDSTFEIMHQMVSEYKGPHEIVLNRNPQNLGLIVHVDIVMNLAKGDFIVVAAGDDISYPERTLSLYKFFVQSDYPACVFSGLDEINNDGSAWEGFNVGQCEQPISSFLWHPGKIRGATCAYDKKTISNFPRLNLNLSAEDRVLPVRAYIMGRPPRMLDQKLIKYRRDFQRVKGSKNLSYKYFWQIWASFSSAKQHEIDTRSYGGIDQRTLQDILEFTNVEKKRFDVVLSKNIFTLAQTSWACLKLFGVRQLIKLWVIKFGKLTQREINLINTLR